MASGIFTLRQVLQGIRQGAWNGGRAPQWVEYLCVAGGGGGGGFSANYGGGGGAGGLLSGILPVTAGATLTVTVGGGGAGGGHAGTNGTNSVFSSITSTGGGGGSSSRSGAVDAYALSGGSGGGSTTYGEGVAGGSGVVGQGNAGGTSGSGAGPGGGGGAGTIGLGGSLSNNNGGNGGAGIASAINGTVTTYAGGGGGGVYSTATAGIGGVGGGGTGGVLTVTNPVDGADNTGGGGGGAGYGQSGGTGGKGIVIVRYPGSTQFYTGGTVWASYDGYVVHSFVASGSLAPTTPTQLNPYPVAFGAAYGGGYFAGRYNLSGTIYNLIVAPVASGYSASSAYKTANTGDTGANSYSDGLTNSNTINDASHPAAQFCRGLTIGGYTDWYLPSVDELNTVYNYLKPGATLNSATPGLGGYNIGAVAPELYNTIHSAGRPRQTGLSTWQVGGAESFGENIYVTSTSDNSASTARNQYFDQGYQWYDNKTNTANKVRAIRKVAV